MFKKVIFIISLFTTVFVAVILSNAVAETWNIEDVDAPKYFKNFNSRAIAIDSNGYPYIAYGYEHLYHAYYDGTSWCYEIVDSDYLVGNNASIAIDSNNHIHISYSSGSYSGSLKYATNSSGSWVTETVPTGVSCRYNSIAIDRNNHVHISHSNYYTGLGYTSNISGSWVTQTVQDDQDVGKYNSIAIDSNNNAHICYYDSDNYDLKYATNSTGSWVTRIVADTIYGENSIAIDSNNHVHIGYSLLSSVAFELRHTTNTSGSWVDETVESGKSGWLGAPSISIDSNDRVHISYASYSEGLKYATNTYGSWIITQLEDNTEKGAMDTSIALDSNNRIHISYFDTTISELKYATNTSGSWITNRIDTRRSAGQCNSLAIDSNNHLHISYRSQCDMGDLRYSTNISGSWITEVVDNKGFGTSIAIDSNNYAHISYCGSAGLTYGTNTSGSWVTETLDSVGTYTSIALDSSDNVHISYRGGYPDYPLKYATNASGSWITVTVDNTADVGNYSSITVDLNSNVHISYYDRTNTALKHATNKSGSWVTETVDNTADVGYYSSIAVDLNNNLHISCYDNTNHDLKYATNISGSWVTETVDNSAIVGQYTSIAIGINNDIHISYYQYGYYDGTLKYATNAFGSWVSETVDSSEDMTVGEYTSIAVGLNNDIHISYSYSDGGTRDLRHVTNLFLGNNYFVDQTYGNDSNNGLTWATAKATIQAGIDLAASKGQGQVFVAVGTYIENISFAPNVQLIGGYPEGGGQKDVFSNVTTIDGGGNGHAVIISDGDGIRIDGLTIKGGNASGAYPLNSGGGIYCSNDCNSPVIINCTITENSADYGGGIYLGNSSPLIKNCIISGNSANDYGGGIYSNAKVSSTIVNCMIFDNTAGLGGGIYAAGNSTITNSNIADNTASNTGGGIYCDASVEPTIKNCVVWGNSSEQISGSSPVITFSCIQDGYPGEGNFDSNPRFVDPGNGNYHLAGDSPCINAGTNEGSPVDDIDNEGRPNRYDVDIGCDEYYGVYIDADSDNLPDYWEYYWFGNLSQDGTSDSDFDGVINFEEYQNGTNPNELAGGVIFVSDDYGDDAHDGHDCSHAKKSIQAAIDAVVDEAVVYIMDGTYEIDVLDPIVIDKNITLKGEDPDTTIIKSVPFAENTGPLSICLMKIGGDVILEGFTFDLPNPLTDYGENIFVDEVCGICAEDIGNKNITIKNNIFKVGRYSTNEEEEGDVIGIKLKGFEEATITIKNNHLLGEYQQDDYVKPVGIYLWPYNYTNYQIEVSNNILSKLESGIYMRTPPSGVSDLIIINNTLDQNDVAISLLSLGEDNLGTARNNIMSNNSIGIGVPSSYLEINLPEYLTYDHNGYFNNTIDITVTDPMWQPYSYPSLGTGHITENPQYLGNGDYHLREGSPCKDAGSSEGAPGDDIDNEVRPYGDNVDIGAYEYKPDPVLASLVAYYPFDQNADDASGNGYDGSVYGATLIGGYYGQAYAFDGNGDYISVPVDINPGVMPQMTMGAWVKADSESSICQFISHDDGDYDRSLGIENPGAGMEWSAFSGSSEVLGYHPVEPDKWTFVAVAYDQDMSSVMFYVDGYAYYGTGTLGPGLNYLHIGSNPTSGGYFKGSIDDVFILDQAFTRAELDDIRENGIPISPPDLADFAAEFGRTDCSGDCKCDFDTDGDIDGSDLAVFSENLEQEGQ